MAEAHASALGTLEVHAAESSGDVAAREHAANLWRLRVVLGIGLALWNAIGIPNDLEVTRTFDLSYAQFTTARVLTTAAQLIAYAGFWTRPSPRALAMWESLLFVSTSAGLGALNHGPAGPTPIFVSCALIAQGIAVPRPFRAGAVMLGATWIAYPLGFSITELLTRRNAAYAGDLEAWFALAHAMFLSAITGGFLAYGGDAFWSLRRRALEAQRVGRYRLRRRLGAGGMGEVWLAEHPGLGGAVALKLARPGAEARLAREIEILGSLSHPSTVRLVDRGRTEDGRLYGAMEHVDGITLAEQIARDGPMDAARAIPIALQLTRALVEVHALEVVHRDLKPENVMIGAIGRETDVVRLIDFGVALRAGDHADEARASAPGRVVGSPRFMAPEQRRGGAVDARADVFGIGALLFFALTGRSPLEGEAGPSYDALARAALPDGAPAALRELIGRCLAIDPHDRPSDAAAVRFALEAISPQS